MAVIDSAELTLMVLGANILAVPKPDEIRRQVEDICKSPALDVARLRRALLRHIVEATLAGTPTTEKAIAVTIYKKDEHTFDPAIDTIARVETGKLRKALKKFYETQGHKALIIITIKRYIAVARCTKYYKQAQLGSSLATPPPQSLPKGTVTVKVDAAGRFMLPNNFSGWFRDIGTSLLRPEVTNGRINLHPEFERWKTPWTQYIQIDLDFRMDVKPRRIFVANRMTGDRSDMPLLVEIPFNILMEAGIDTPSELYLWREGDHLALATEKAWTAQRQS